MMQHLGKILLLVLTIFWSFAGAQDPVAIINDYQVDFRVIDRTQAIERVKKSITIFKKDGDSFAQPYVFYDQFIRVKSFECKQTDTAGKDLKKFRNGDVLDESITQAGTIYDDNRIKYFPLQKTTYPYVVTYEYEVEYNGLLHYPRFYPQPDFNVEVEHSQLTVSVPKDLDLRYKLVATDIQPSIRESSEVINYSWELNQLKAVNEELLSPPPGEILPSIYLGPNDFEYDGYPGSLRSWETFGDWLYKLLPANSSLDPREKEKIKSIAAGCKSTIDKVSALYEYMQKKTRYVSIQLGIGGFQPMPPDKVSELGYGDCKALSNYMRTILAAADIPAYYTVIGAGRTNTSFSFTDFPNSFQANHVILTVPITEDTVFLECTSQKNPCGYLGSFTGGRNALLVSEDGGKMIETTRLKIEDYLHHTVASYVLQNDGSLEGKYEKNYHGVAHEAVQGYDQKSETDMRNDFLAQINHPGLDLKSINYTIKEDKNPDIEEIIGFNIPGYAQMSGDRIFFNPNVFSRWSFQLTKNDSRKQPIDIGEPTYEVDSVIFSLPDGFLVEANIDPVHLSNEFGEFRVAVENDRNKLIFIRELKLHKGRYPKERYEELRYFFKEIIKTDKAQLVLVQKKT
ncbi:MAG: DUF3857 domain-containing protein [Saprospiraceae bacterium]|nr:DUF3857 domain-containing protein [Saprospiraceae bacterium]